MHQRPLRKEGFFVVKRGMSEKDKRFLSEKDKVRYAASHNLPWMYEAALNVHATYLESLNVDHSDAQRVANCSDVQRSRKEKYEFILRVMAMDDYFAEMIEPEIRAIALLFEDES
jgi:hypothetical protein